MLAGLAAAAIIGVIAFVISLFMGATGRHGGGWSSGGGSWSGWTAGMHGRGVGSWREEKHEGGFALLFIQN